LASIWAEDTKHHCHDDNANFDDIAGYVFIKPTDDSESAVITFMNPTTLASILGTDKPITPHPSTPNAFRVTVGNRGRDGVVAVTSLKSVKSRVPQKMMVKREKNKLTLLRNKSLKTIYNTITHVITTQPTLNGLKVHKGSNSSNIFLSYHERKEALDYKNKNAPAYQYPVWEHISYEP